MVRALTEALTGSDDGVSDEFNPISAEDTDSEKDSASAARKMGTHFVNKKIREEQARFTAENKRLKAATQALTEALTK